MDKENAAPASINAFDPLEALEEAQTELDSKLARSFSNRLHKQAYLQRVEDEKAGWKAAKKLTQEEEDALVAQRLQEQFDKEISEIKRQQEQQDHKLVRQLSKQELKKYNEHKKTQEKLAKRDAKLAKRMQTEEDKLAQIKWKELRWDNPQIHYDEHEDYLRFWIKLPGLEHANVVIAHNDNQTAVINIEATPEDTSLVPCTFSVDLKLNANEPLEISPEDINVRYHEESHILEICCMNLKLEPSKTSRFVSKLKSIFSR